MKPPKRESEDKWYAIMTRFRNEKAVARQLKKQGVGAYVPLRKIIRQYASGKKVYEVPLINCYVFVKIKLRDYLKVLETQGVFHFVKFSAQIAEIPENEIETLQQITKVGHDLEVISHQFREGDAVIVVSGVLKGIEGKLVKINNKRKFIVEFEKIGRSIVIEIDASNLQRVTY